MNYQKDINILYFFSTTFSRLRLDKFEPSKEYDRTETDLIIPLIILHACILESSSVFDFSPNISVPHYETNCHWK